MPEQAVIARRTPCIVESRSRHCLYVSMRAIEIAAVSAMDPIQGLCSRRWRFTLKRRNAWRSVVVADKSLPFCDGSHSRI